MHTSLLRYVSSFVLQCVANADDVDARVARLLLSTGGVLHPSSDDGWRRDVAGSRRWRSRRPTPAPSGVAVRRRLAGLQTRQTAPTLAICPLHARPRRVGNFTASYIHWTHRPLVRQMDTRVFDHLLLTYGETERKTERALSPFYFSPVSYLVFRYQFSQATLNRNSRSCAIVSFYCVLQSPCQVRSTGLEIRGPALRRLDDESG